MAKSLAPMEPPLLLLKTYSVWLLGLAAFGCTWIGGAIALQLGPRIRYLTGLSSGAVVGLALFDLIPEAASLGGSSGEVRTVMLAVGVGFCLYMALQRLLTLLGARTATDHLGAASLTLHSFSDGLGIGLAFKVSPRTGLAVAAAVLAHDLCDGVNTISVALRGEGRRARWAASRWLGVNAAAPLAGIAIATFAPVAPSSFPALAAVFAGAFLYIGAVELLPRSLDGWGSPLAIVPMMVGVTLIYAVASVTR